MLYYLRNALCRGSRQFKEKEKGRLLQTTSTSDSSEDHKSPSSNVIMSEYTPILESKGNLPSSHYINIFFSHVQIIV